MCSLYVAISNFLFEHRRQRFVCGLYGTHVFNISHLALTWMCPNLVSVRFYLVTPFRFYFHVNEMIFCDWKIVFKGDFAGAKTIFFLIIWIAWCYFSFLSDVCCEGFCSNGHVSFFKQLHVLWSVLFLGNKISALWEFIMVLIFCV